MHVRSADGEVVIELATAARSQTIRSVSGMRIGDVAAASWIVAAPTDYLLQCWRNYHD
ncbi:MAG: hypothetical protein ACR2GK_03995 [Gemmatimonadaceae bacterium]